MVYVRQNSVVKQAFQGSKYFDELYVYTDGAARGNPGPAGIGVLVQTRDGKPVAAFGQWIGVATNNFAEYTAVIHALRLLSSFNVGRVHLRSDSELVVRQLQGVYKVKDRTLQSLYSQAMALLRRYREFDIQHIGRESNKEADKLANQAIDAGPGPGEPPVLDAETPDSPQTPLF